MSVVGKYRYSMASPAENDRVPIIVDIILVTSSLCWHNAALSRDLVERRLYHRFKTELTPCAIPGVCLSMQDQLRAHAEVGAIRHGGA